MGTIGVRPPPRAMTAPPDPAAPERDPVDDCATRLRARFPALFGAEMRPLKLHIQADIRERAPGEFGRRELSAFLHRYTGSNAYLRTLVRATQRVDLDGAEAGEVSEEHRRAAAAELERRRGLREARLAREDAERRERAALLRAFETTTLSRDNFCALKGLAPDRLDALLAQAREEAAAAPPRPRRSEPPARPPRGQGRPAPR